MNIADDVSRIAEFVKAVECLAAWVLAALLFTAVYKMWEHAKKLWREG